MAANGRLPISELEVVEDNDLLNHVAAFWFRKARAAYVAEGGRNACIVEPAGGYRSYDVQYDMKHGIPSFAYWNLNPLSKAGLASPGNSTHGFGDSLDAMPGFHAFLLRRGREFGFYRPYLDRDPNHWRHNGTAPTGGLVTPISPEEDDMTRYIHTAEDGEGFALLDFNFVDGVVVAPRGPVAEQMSYVTRGGAPESMDRKTFNAACASAAALWRSNAYKAASPERDAAAIAASVVAQLAPTLATDADLDALRDELIAQLPPAVIVEQKKPGN